MRAASLVLATKMAPGSGSAANLHGKERAEKAIFDDLVQWRLEKWKNGHKSWPALRPDAIISDEDLAELAKPENAIQIIKAEELLGKIRTNHQKQYLAQVLLVSLKESAAKHYGAGYALTLIPTSTVTKPSILTEISANVCKDAVPTLTIQHWLPGEPRIDEPPRQKKRKIAHVY